MANDIQGKEIETLKARVFEGRQLAARQQKEIRDKEHELEDLQARLLKKEKTNTILPQSQNDTPVALQHDPQVISRLRDRIENLKLDISRGQQERRTLRKQIKQTIEQADGQAKIAEKGDGDDSTGHSIEFEDAPKKILFPEFSNDYQNSCNNIAGSIVVKSLKAAAGFAAHDRLVWRQTKALTGLTSIYSIRVGIHHRLLIRWEKDSRLEVLELIPREQWIFRVTFPHESGHWSQSFRLKIPTNPG